MEDTGALRVLPPLRRLCCNWELAPWPQAASKSRVFKFDTVFGPEADQESVFSAIKPAVLSLVEGYNSTVFAYG